jgi:hypothetical protein
MKKAVGIYFRTDTTRLTFGELWRISSRLPVFLRACVNKVFGLRAPVRWAVRHELTIRALHTEEVPGAALAVLEPLIEEFQQLGARLAFYHATPAVGNLEGYAAVLLPPEHNFFIVVVWARSQISRWGNETSGCGVTSQLQNGSFFTTTNLPRKFNKPPASRVLRLRGATPTELAERHQEAVAESGLSAILIHSEEQLKSILEEIKRRNFEWHLGRGVYLPLTGEELARLGLPVADDF